MGDNEDDSADPTVTAAARDDAGAAPTFPIQVTTAAGQQLVVREVEPDDVVALERLYSSLDHDDTYRRFFTATRPRHEFFERLARIRDRDGACIVVVAARDPDDRNIVAEASFERLANGNGEFAIAVEKEWRGWMGPYLLDILRELASQRGVANLEAEILTCNRPMRALTSRLGEAVLPGSDWQTVRVVISTTGHAPAWQPSPRPTVLVELSSLHPDALSALSASGFEVAACTGRRGAGPPCPLFVDGDDCPLAADADLVVVAVADDEERERLLAAHRRRHPQVSSVGIGFARPGGLTGDALIATVEQAIELGRPGASRPPSGRPDPDS